MSAFPPRLKNDYERIFARPESIETCGGIFSPRGLRSAANEFGLGLFRPIIDRWQSEARSSAGTGDCLWPCLAFACSQYQFLRSHLGKSEPPPKEIASIIAAVEKHA